MSPKRTKGIIYVLVYALKGLKIKEEMKLRLLIT